MYKFIYKRQCSYVFIGENAMPVWKLMTSVEKLQKSKKNVYLDVGVREQRFKLSAKLV